MKSETTGFSTLLDAPANVAATKELNLMLGQKVFAFPKPPGLVNMLVRQVTDKDSLILDSFCGSGTTGQAVLQANKDDGGNRRFILVELDQNICQAITAERLRRVICGYAYGTEDSRNGEIAGLGGGFRFCKLSNPIFDENGHINGEVRFADLAAHVFFTETGEPIPKRPIGKNPSPLIGVCNGTAYYLLFNGVLGDKRPNGGNVLTARILAELPGFAGKPLRPGDPAHDGPKVIYGEGSRLGAARLKREGITFKQVPYEIKVS